MGRVLAISSQVARGAIGLSAAVPALQVLGHEVIALPTILLSNHPGHPRFAGDRVSTLLLGSMLDSLDANGWLAGLDAILTGYLPSPQHVAFAKAAIERAKQRSESALHVCDPVIGDHPKGLYIGVEAANAIRADLVPRADVLKMNRFEAEWLSGATLTGSRDVATAAALRGWRSAIVTSLPTADAGTLSNVLVEDTTSTADVEVARCPSVPNGTGDLLGALWLGHRLRGCTGPEALRRAVAGVQLVISRSLRSDELQLAGTWGELAHGTGDLGGGS
ncbi:MAG: PfkB family carbohydrate kinase [Hyphomicrobiaceae bacterium]